MEAINQEELLKFFNIQMEPSGIYKNLILFFHLLNGSWKFLVFNGLEQNEKEQKNCGFFFFSGKLMLFFRLIDDFSFFSHLFFRQISLLRHWMKTIFSSNNWNKKEENSIYKNTVYFYPWGIQFGVHRFQHLNPIHQ